MDQQRSGNLETTLSGVFHTLKYGKYGQLYLAVFAYQFNRRIDLCRLVAGLIFDLARSKSVQENMARQGPA